MLQRSKLIGLNVLHKFGKYLHNSHILGFASEQMRSSLLFFDFFSWCFPVQFVHLLVNLPSSNFRFVNFYTIKAGEINKISATVISTMALTRIMSGVAIYASFNFLFFKE